jgi:hypothetical protein
VKVVRRGAARLLLTRGPRRRVDRGVSEATPTRNRWPLLGGLLLVAAVFLVGLRPEERAATVPKTLEKKPNRVAPASDAPPPPEEVPSGPAAASAERPRLNAGFCAPPGEDASFTIHHTLAGLVHDELVKRSEAGADDDLFELLRSAQSLKKGEAAGVLATAERLATRRPDEALVAVVRAMAAGKLGRSEVELAALRDAVRLDPNDPAIAMAAADRLRHTPLLDEALRALAVFASAEEESPALARMRARIEVERDIERGYRRREQDGITLSWPDGALTEAEAGALLAAVTRDLDEASRLLDTPRRAMLSVVVYPGHEELLAVSCVNAWAAALYDGRLRVVADAEQPTKIDLATIRHETLHAALMPFAPDAPLWFHEGVAQQFAHEEKRATLQRWRLMVANRSYIPFASLDGSFQAFEGRDDASLAYAQSLGLVSFLVDRRGESVVARAARDFREGLDTSAVLAREAGAPVTGDDLLDFLARRLVAVAASGGP